MSTGVLLLDKPSSMTSMQCVEFARDMTDSEKAGHSGTLDLRVTGLLLIALDEAVKAMPVFGGMEKEYEGLMTLHCSVSEKDIRKAISEFTGKIRQVPPKRSAVARKEREREIYSFDILDISGRTVSFRVRCEAGTYIRKLCSDIGERLGCGANMQTLRRTRIGNFSIDEAFTTDDVKGGSFKTIGLEDALFRAGLKRVVIADSAVSGVCNGSPVRRDGILSSDNIEKEKIVGIFSPKGRIIALGVPEGDLLKTKRVFRQKSR